MPFIECASEGLIDEYNAKAILRKYSISTPKGLLFRDGKLPGTIPLRFPLVTKAVDSRLLHKSDVGAVIVGIRDRQQLTEAFEEIKRRFPGRGILVEEMIMGNVEAILGVSKNNTFGHVIMLGTGGALAEIFDDVSFRTADISETDILEMINETSLGKFAQGFRGIRISKKKIVDAVISISNLIRTEGSCIDSLDINPLILTEDNAIAADAKIVVSGNSLKR
ncbi:MAG: acetate--CoA ligase family protein [Candidatus Thermoplasmatota archaeon]|nr:acetate--CoA ligase family protein [Candidatus Thermoplasmatota archaeon]